MNTSKWTYISRNGERNLITILHSPRLGHFLIFFNRKIVLANKKVFNQDSYSFFIDDELCIVDIRTVSGKYTYTFQVDKKADTPLNQFRKKNDQKNLYYSLTTFGFLFFMVGIAMVAIFHQQDSAKWKSILENAILTTAEIQIIELKRNQFHVFYSYKEGNINYRDIIQTDKTSNPILDNGFPIETSDAFFLTYSSKMKRNNKLHLDYPTPKTTQRYRILGEAKYQENHPAANSSYCDCIADIAYELKDWKGYALLYNEQNLSSDNERFNQKEYQSFVNSTPFLDAEVDCWKYK